MTKKGEYKWLCLIVSTLLMLFMGLIYAWSIFRQPLNELFTEWTPSDLSRTFMISMISFCTGGFVSGKMSAVIKHRWIIMIAATFLLVGFVGISRFDVENPQKSLVMLYLFYGALCGIGIGLAYNAILSTVTKWFSKRAGMASGVLLMGFGVGGMILGSAVTVLTNAYGLSATFLILGISIAAVLAAGSFFIKLPPQDEKTAAAGGEVPLKKNYTVVEMLKTVSFWLFCAWMILVSSGGLMIINSAAVIAVTFGASAVLGLIVSVFNGAGRVLMGILFDKLGREKAMLIDTLVMMLAGTGLLLGAVLNNAVMIFIGMSLVGVAYGGAPALTSATILSFYGSKHYGANLGTANFAIIAASIIGPMISSYLQENAGGTYNSTFLMIIAVSTFALLVSILINLFSKQMKEVKEK